MMNSDHVVFKIKVEAESLGFCLFGITIPSAPVFFIQFSKWLEKEQFGDMAYLANPRTIVIRRDPSKFLNGCNSIMVLGLSYAASGLDGSRLNESFIASYALKKDYHHIIKQKHKTLISYIGSMLPDQKFLFRSAIDSAPVLEKSLAYSAGLGWIGKNGCLINSQYGSQFFLSEIFTTLELPPSIGISNDLCGNCTRCIESCPTQCIQPDRTLNAMNCISYLTIEHKGDIDPSMRNKLGSHLFGCDVCQTVCPWNQKTVDLMGLNTVQRLEIDPNPQLESCLLLSEDAFLQIYGHTPINRTGYKRFLRNVIIAIGNSGDKKYTSLLARFIQVNLDEQLRNTAKWALGEIKGYEAQVMPIKPFAKDVN